MPRIQKPNNDVARRMNSERDSKLKSIMAKGQPSNPVDWSEIDPSYIAALVSAVTAEGGGVTFGYTRGQNAYRIGVYLADERNDMYFSDVELMYGWIKTLCEELGSL